MRGNRLFILFVLVAGAGAIAAYMMMEQMPPGSFSNLMARARNGLAEIDFVMFGL